MSSWKNIQEIILNGNSGPLWTELNIHSFIICPADSECVYSIKEKKYRIHLADLLINGNKKIHFTELKQSILSRSKSWNTVRIRISGDLRVKLGKGKICSGEGPQKGKMRLCKAIIFSWRPDQSSLEINCNSGRSPGNLKSTALLNHFPSHPLPSGIRNV